MQNTVGEEKKMGVFPDQNKLHKKGGFRTMPFIIVNESFEKVASYGLMPNMVFYLLYDYHMKVASASSLLLIWSAISNAMAIFGAFLADSYLGRFRVIVLGSFSSLLGMTLLWLTTMIPQMKPDPCELMSKYCTSATPAQLTILYTSFGLISIGAGCIRPCSMSFGADQLDKKGDPNNERHLQSFYNWYYASIGISTVLALTIIVYIQDHLGWRVGFGVPAILMVLSALLFVVGTSLYVKVKADKSLFTGFAQVLVVAFKNRKVKIPTNGYEESYHQSHDSESEHLALTDNLRCLNKACVIKDPVGDLKPDGSALNPWRLCTVYQVESLKSLIRVLPMWSTGIIMLVSLNQNFGTLQAKTMDRHIINSFQFPAGSFTIFTIVTLTIWVAFYDRVGVPFLAKYCGRPRGLHPITRMGIGLVLSIISVVLAAIMESIRRRKAIEQGLEDQPRAVMDMSAMWLVPQYAIMGLAEAFNALGQIEFYYSQFPKSMASVAYALFTLGMALSSLVGTLLVDAVNSVTSKGGKESWLADNLNKGHIDYFYWLIAVLCAINFLYFLVVSWFYGSSENKKTRESDEVNEHVEYRNLTSPSS